jgi:putative MATE family efflux protein
MDRSMEMKEGSIGSLLWSFSLPAIIGMSVNALYNIVGRIFVGRGIGALAIAATTVAFPLMIIIMAVSILVGVGATALISIRLGEDKKEAAEKIAANAITMIILLSAIFAALFFVFTEQVLTICGASPEVMPYARDYTQIIMLGAVFGSFSMGVNNFIRAEGNPKMAMYTQLLGAAANIALNYLFIFPLGWGIKGSALATILAQLLSSLWVLSYYLRGKSLVKLRLANFRPSWPILSSMMAIGFAPFAMQIASSIQQVILNKTLMAYSGDLALSAIGIIMSIATMLFMPVLGLAQGAQPIIGFNYGARQYQRVAKTWKLAVAGGTLIALLGNCKGISVLMEDSGYMVFITRVRLNGNIDSFTGLSLLTAECYLSIALVSGFAIGYYRVLGGSVYCTAATTPTTASAATKSLPGCCYGYILGGHNKGCDLGIGISKIHIC